MLKIHYILVEPYRSENIGASARALKTMGFNSLRLINPMCNYLDNKAKALAHGSIDILEHAEVFSSFAEAIYDIDFLIATTARKRRVNYDYHTPEQIAKYIKGKKNTIKNIAIVFGCEESGLQNEYIDMCDLVSIIPMKQKYPSLNLSQAVMLYAYILSPLISNTKKKRSKVHKPEFYALKEKVSSLLPIYQITKQTIIYKRIMERLAVCSEDDIHILHTLCNKIAAKKN